VSSEAAFKILAGFDGSPESRDALHLAAGLARAEHATLEVASALDWFPVPVASAAYEQSLALDFDELFGKAERELPGVAFVRRELRVNRDMPRHSAVRALIECAVAEAADLIVIGSTHRGTVGRIYPGSVGERLLNGSPCAVAVAPRGYAQRDHFGFGLVGVAYDGSEESAHALAAADPLARRLDARLRLIAVIHPLEALPGRPAPTRAGYREELRERLRERLEEALGRLPGPLDVESVIEEGDPAAALADQGVELDLLVIGSRGYGPLRRTLLGGVSAEVMRTAPCPVMVVPRSAARA
jgi:nucleotide-binding universal stress UspA family protein